MKRVRVVCLGLLALLCSASVARADLAGPWPWSRTPPRPDRALVEMNLKLIAEGKEPIKFEEPPRTGPFRSCGSGAGLGFAGIGVAWGLMWVGHRFVGRVRK